MKSITKLLLAAAVFAAARPALAATIDNFEGYSDGQVVGSYDGAHPWVEYGGVGDPLTATSWATGHIDGTLTGVIGADFSASAYLLARKQLSSPTDFTALGSSADASVLLRSLAGTSNLQVSLSIVGGDGTEYQSTQALAVPTTDAASLQPLTFSLDPSAFTLADGDQSIETVLSSATQIGFLFTLAPGSTSASEALAIDDFQANAVPEPCSFALVGGGLMTIALRRRR